MTIHDFIKKQIAFFFRTKIKKTNALIFSIGIGNFNKTSSTMPAKNINVFLEKYYNIIEKVAVKYGGFVSLDMLSEILVTFPKENIKNNSEMVSGIVKEIFTHFKDLINKERDNSILSINIGVDLGIVIVTNKIWVFWVCCA